MNDKLYYQIIIPCHEADESGMCVCEASNPQIASNIVHHLLTAERKRPLWVKIVPRKEMPEHD